MKKSKTTLTHKQAIFSKAVAAGESLADAYKLAYRTANMKPASIRREGSRLYASPIIATTIETMKGDIEKNKKVQDISARELVIQKLRHFIEQGTSEDAIKLRATEILARASSMFNQQLTVTTEPRSAAAVADEIERRLAAISGHALESEEPPPREKLN